MSCVLKERDSIIDESERLTALLSTAKEDVVKVSELLERTDKEKRRLQEKNAKLTITGAFTIASHKCLLESLIIPCRMYLKFSVIATGYGCPKISS